MLYDIIILKVSIIFYMTMIMIDLHDILCDNFVTVMTMISH